MEYQIVSGIPRLDVSLCTNVVRKERSNAFGNLANMGSYQALKVK